MSGHQFGCSRNTNSIVLIFFGSCMVFSDRLLRTLKFEFDEIDVLRLRDIQELTSLDDNFRIATKLIIFDEASMEALLNSRGELDQIYVGVEKVLAYSSPEVARNLQKIARSVSGNTQFGFLPMKAPLDAWFAALRLLLMGEAFVPAEILEETAEPRAEPALPCSMNGSGKVVATEQKASLPDGPNLTERESQVLELVAGGLPNKSIADRLNLSEHTVKLHVHHIFGKLGVQNRASATNWFLSRKEPVGGLEGI